MKIILDKVLEYEAPLKNKLKSFTCIAFAFHSPVSNFAGAVK
jgi:hypothetical protein